MNITKKIGLLGDPAVGKTSLVSRFVYDSFDDRYISTIGAKVVKKEMLIGEYELKLMIWDMLGQDTFYHLVSSTLKGVEGAFIVFDLTRKVTLDRIPELITMITGIGGEIPVIILGNKNDLEDRIEVSKEEVENVLGDKDYLYLTTSAKTGENVELAFLELGKMILDKRKQEE